MENQTNGQVIRSYSVNAKVVDVGGSADGTLDVGWTVLSNGTSIGHKKIDIFEPVTVTEVLVDTTYVDMPVWRSVSVHLCDVFTGANKTGWEFTP